jgi:prefoldin subunit 5
LSELYEDDIIATIDAYQSFDELKEMIAMHDESLDLEIDKYLDAIEEYENKLSEKDAEIERLKAENAALKSQAKSTS